MKLNQPYVGIFLRKKEDDKSDVVLNLDDLHQVGVFAQIHEMQDMDYKLRLVVMAHRRIRITGQFIEDEIESGPAGELYCYFGQVFGYLFVIVIFLPLSSTAYIVSSVE